MRTKVKQFNTQVDVLGIYSSKELTLKVLQVCLVLTLIEEKISV